MTTRQIDPAEAYLHHSGSRERPDAFSRCCVFAAAVELQQLSGERLRFCQADEASSLEEKPSNKIGFSISEVIAPNEKAKEVDESRHADR